MKVTRFVHVNVNCSDLDASIRFYKEVLGAELLERFDSDVDTREVMGIPDGAINAEAALVYWVGNKHGPYVDLVQWLPDPDSPPVERRRPLGPQDLGAPRIALEVDDLDAWRAHLEERGVPIRGRPYEGGTASWTVKYLLCEDPDGMLIELVQFPQGTGRKKDAS